MNLGQVLLNSDETRNTKWAQVTEIWSATKAHLERRHVVGVGRRGQPIADVGGGDDCFTPEARRKRSIDDYGARNSEDDANRAFSDIILVRCAYTGELSKNIRLGE